MSNYCCYHSKSTLFLFIKIKPVGFSKCPSYHGNLGDHAGSEAKVGVTILLSLKPVISIR